MEIDIRYGEDKVLRVSDVRLVRGRLDNPYLLTWELEGKVCDEWEYLMMVTPDKRAN